MNDVVIELQNVKKIYKMDGVETPALRGVDLKISKGKFIIDGSGDKVSWVLESKYQYSETDTVISLGNLKLKTTGSDPWNVEIWADYSGLFDLTYSERQETKELDAAPSPYSVFIKNLGKADGMIQIDMTAE